MIVFLSKIKEWVGDCGVVEDKPSVEVSKAKERLYILDFGGGRPDSNAIEFDWVHGKLTGLYNHSGIFDFRDVKLTFFEL